MSDPKLRELERSDPDSTEHLAWRLRSGGLTLEQVEIAALCGSVRAADVLGVPPTDWTKGFESRVRAIARYGSPRGHIPPCQETGYARDGRCRVCGGSRPDARWLLRAALAAAGEPLLRWKTRDLEQRRRDPRVVWGGYPPLMDGHDHPQKAFDFAWKWVRHGSSRDYEQWHTFGTRVPSRGTDWLPRCMADGVSAPLLVRAILVASRVTDVPSTAAAIRVALIGHALGGEP